jgi:hypothetical protein
MKNLVVWTSKTGLLSKEVKLKRYVGQRNLSVYWNSEFYFNLFIMTDIQKL